MEIYDGQFIWYIVDIEDNMTYSDVAFESFGGCFLKLSSEIPKITSPKSIGIKRLHSITEHAKIMTKDRYYKLHMDVIELYPANVYNVRQKSAYSYQPVYLTGKYDTYEDALKMFLISH